MQGSRIIVPDSVRDAAEKSLGAYFETFSKTLPQNGADDHLDVESHTNAHNYWSASCR